MEISGIKILIQISRNKVKCLHVVKYVGFVGILFFTHQFVMPSLIKRSLLLLIAPLAFPAFPLKGNWLFFFSLGTFNSTSYLNMYLN